MANEIGVKLTGDNSHFRSMLSQSVEEGGKFAGKLAGKVGDNLGSLNKVSNTLATALGLNLQNIAENAARWFTGMSKETEEAFKKLADVSERVADANIALMRAQLSEEQRYQLAIIERGKLEKAIAENSAKTVQDQLRQKQDELKLIQKSAEIQAYEAKVREEAAKKAEAAAKAATAAREKEYQLQLSTLTTDGKIASLKESIVVLQNAIASGVLSQKNAEELAAVVTERQLALKAEEVKKEKELAEVREEAAKEHMADMDKLTKLKFEALPLDEKIAALEKERATITANMRKAKADGIDTTKMEIALLENAASLDGLREQQTKATAATLGEQLDTLQKQGVSENQIVALLRGRGFSEEEILGTLEKQTRELAKQQGFFMALQRKGSGYESQSTAALEGVLANVRAQLDRVKQENAVAGRSERNPMEFALQNEFDNITRELSMRRNVGGYAERFGEDAARRQYGDTLTERALRDMQDASTRTAQTLSNIEQRLANSGLFPRS